MTALATRSIVVEQLRDAFEREVLALHRHEHGVRGGEAVDGEESERRRRVDEDVVVVAGDRLEHALEVVLAADGIAQLDLGADEIDRRRREKERRDLGRPDDVAERHVLDEHVVHRRASASVTPRPEVAFACGSRSTRRTRRSQAATEAPRLMAVVVLPTPPF